MSGGGKLDVASGVPGEKLVALLDASNVLLQAVVQGDRRKALELLARHIHDILEAESCTIFLFAEQVPTVLVPEAHFADKSITLRAPEQYKILSLPRSDLSSFLAETRQIIRFSESEIAHHPVTSDDDRSIYSLLGIPLATRQGDLAGLIIVENKKGVDGLAGKDVSFSDIDVSLARLLANQAIISLESLRALTNQKNSEQLYESLVETLPVAIFRKDRDGKFTFANQTYLKILGTSADQVIGKTDYDFYPSELAKKYKHDDLLVLRGEGIIDLEERHAASDSDFHVHVMKVPLRDRDNEIAGIQCVFWDMTDRIRDAKLREESLREKEHLLHELRTTLRRLQKVTKILTVAAISTSIVHDVADPLTNIRGYCSELLVRLAEWEPAFIAARLGKIHGLCEGGLINIDRIRRFARTGKMEMKSADLNKLIIRCLSRVENRFEQKGIHIERDFPELPRVSMDETTMRLVFENIFGNALRCLSRDCTLRVTTSTTGAGEVRVVIRDTGPGFPLTILSDFASPDSRDESGEAEYGLGLVIAQAVIGLHEGKMTIENAGGAIIEISLKI